MADLRTLDFSKFTHGSITDQESFGQELVASFKNHGFVKLINHGIQDETISSKFFELPTAVKNETACVRGPFPQRGWGGVGFEQTSKVRKENLVGRNADDLMDEREHFDAGPIGDTLYPNRWPRDEVMPGFQSFMEETYNVCQSKCLEIMKAVELGLHIEPDTLVQRCQLAASEMRMNRYPQVAVERLADGSIKRTWPHTDFGIVTLLFQDEVGGLELEDRKQPGSFVPVKPTQPGQKSEMVVNISDTFQRWTNDVIRAGVHQVAPPPAYKGMTEGFLPERHSFVFFFKASRDVSVGPLPTFVTPENQAKYDEITALEYQQRKTQQLLGLLD
ncbi:oxidoreductase [Xylaria castorea]|nr:oxidoreductase [Xylaria castorea]